MTPKQKAQAYAMFDGDMDGKWSIRKWGKWYRDIDIQTALNRVVSKFVGYTNMSGRALQIAFECAMEGKFRYIETFYGDPTGFIHPEDLKNAVVGVIEYVQNNDIAVVMRRVASVKMPEYYNLGALN